MFLFIAIFILVRKLLKLLDNETYTTLKVPFCIFLIMTILFMLYRIAYFTILQFQVIGRQANAY